MRRFAILFICCCILFLPAAASAQTVAVTSLQINIWPEYDRPEVLVIFHYTLDESVQLPADITLRIPAVTGGPYNLAYARLNSSGDSQLFNLEYDVRQLDDWMEISFTAPTQAIQLEYYDPSMTRTGEHRDYTFRWAADYAVESMAVQVMKPVNAVEMKMDPELGAAGILQNGRTYYQSLIGAVQAGEQFQLRIEYDRPDDKLDEGYDSVFSAAEDVSPTQFTLRDALPWLIGALGILLITIAVVWYLIPNSMVRDRKNAVRAGAKVQTKRLPVYCHNCGTAARSDDVFCRMCGTKLRR